MAIQDPRAAGSRESYLRRSWVLNFVSLGPHLMTGVEQDPRAARILGLLFQKPAAETEGALTAFGEAMNMPAPGQSLMCVPELLESLAFQWVDATSVEPIELRLFADLNSDSCLRPDAPGGLVSDISTCPPAPIPPSAMLSPTPFSSSLRPGAHDNIVLSRLQDGFSPVRSSSPRDSHGSIMNSCSTPMLDSGTDSGLDPGVLPGFDDISQFTRTPKAYHYVNDVTIGTRLARNPKFSLGANSPRSCTPQRRVRRMRQTPLRALVPRSLQSARLTHNCLPLQHGPSEIATPQTGSPNLSWLEGTSRAGRNKYFEGHFGSSRY
ncbi:hypothetical protein BDV93DRAFT_558608 [Ceratobasidium sp. AG-I]|nr:hypothetical protein BDV93DRAFT_558608 [Ceratobasidium sp. AG-I]